MKKLLALWLVLMLLLPVFGTAGVAENAEIAETSEGTELAEIPPETEETAEAAEEVEAAVGETAEAAEEAEAEELAEAAEEEEPAEKLPVNLNYDYDELVVGSTMPMYGTFSFSMWGNAGSDIDVRKLIHGYNLVQWDSSIGGFEFDPNVVSGELVEAEDGDHIYNLFLCDDMYYSDGTPITAYDYAFSILLRMSPVIRELGGVPNQMDYLVGYNDYITGAADTLAGVIVNGPYQMTIRISGDHLPYFYEMGLLNCNPYPASVIAPGCEVLDDGNGIYLSTPLTAEMLQATLLDANTGYLSHPSVTTGAYKLVSYDGQEAVFELNEYYKGNSLGEKPTIPRIVFRTANQETMIDDLANAKFGLLNKVTRVDGIRAGSSLVTDTQRYKFTNYPRAGVSFIAFNTEHPAVAEAEVRQAIALCLDKEGLTADYTGNYGLAVDAFYGVGQWMFQMINGTLSPEAPEDATEEELEQLEKDWEEVTLDEVEKYEFDPEAAAQKLEDAGWKLNANGIREKEINGETVTLELKMYYPTATPISEFLQARFAEPLKQAGIALTIEAYDNPLLKYYGQEERDYDMVFLATNFDVMYDPSPLFALGSATNYTGIEDQELYDLAADMKKTEQGDLLTYCQKWVLFLHRFAEVEPMIPVYSNVYYDFYPDVLQDYVITENITWSEAIVPAYLSDPAEEPEEENAEEAGALQEMP